MDLIHIRRARKEDTSSIVQNNLAMARETENKTLDQKTLTHGVESVLANERHGFYAVAEVDGRLAGQFMITTEWSDWRNSTFWWIQSVYVLPEYRRKGVYRKLHRYILDCAKAEKACGIRLYVDKNNANAKKTYAYCGLQEAHYAMFEVDFVLGK